MSQSPRSKRHQPSDWFPKGIATGVGFCNREQEQLELRRSLLLGQHVWIDAQRRFGKTSLIRKVASELGEQSDWVTASTSFFAASDVRTVARPLLNLIAEAAVAACDTQTQAIQKRLLAVFSDLSASLQIGPSGLSLSFAAAEDKNADHATALLKALNALADFAKSRRKKVLLILDEFQRIGDVNDGVALEGAIREFAQVKSAVRFVFAGSEQTMMQAVFQRRSRPLYHLCDRLVLSRIEAQHYHPHMQLAAQDRWNKPVAEDAVDQLLTVTERHPFYVNTVAQRLWHEPRPPTTEAVAAAWERVVEAHASIAQRDIMALSHAQKRFLIALLATGKGPRSKDFLEVADIPSSSSSQAQDRLQTLGIIEKDRGRWQLADPVTATLLHRQIAGGRV